MKIKKLRLKNNFKRFYDLTIDLGESPKRIVALIGPNGCGKSSVLDGMLFLNGAYEKVGKRELSDAFYYLINHQDEGSRDEKRFNHVEIEFESGDLESTRKQKASGKQNTIFSFRSPYRYNSGLRISESKATDSIEENNYGASKSAEVDEKIEENYLRLYVKYNRYLNDKDCKPSEAKAKILQDLNSSLKNCIDLEITNIGSIEEGRGTLFFTKSDYTTEFEFNVLSAGEKEVVDLLLDLYLRQDEYDDSIFLIDEPELHVNTAIQRQLLLEINRLIGANCQLWICTHSIGFLRALQEELKDECQIIQFEKDTKYASEPVKLTPMKKSISKWNEVFETALDDLSGLVCPRRVIYCEGKDKPNNNGEEKGFDAKVLNNIFGEKYQDTLFVSSGGNTELDQRSDIALSIITKFLPDMEIWVFKDRDVSSGKPNDESDRQRYLDNNSDNHRIMKRWEIENYLFDKEVLQAYCAKENLVFNEQKYDSLVTNINDDHIKDMVSGVKSACGITTSLNPEKFKLNLSNVISEDMAVFRELEACIFHRE